MLKRHTTPHTRVRISVCDGSDIFFFTFLLGPAWKKICCKHSSTNTKNLTQKKKKNNANTILFSCHIWALCQKPNKRWRWWQNQTLATAKVNMYLCVRECVYVACVCVCVHLAQKKTKRKNLLLLHINI